MNVHMSCIKTTQVEFSLCTAEPAEVRVCGVTIKRHKSIASQWKWLQLMVRYIYIDMNSS